MNKELKHSFKNLLNSFNVIATYASDYNPKEYLELLENLKGEIDYEIEVIRRDINK